jgi:hypothetical protein
MKNLKYLAITGNAVFIAWLFINGLDEGFKATNVQLVSYLGLTAVLLLNIFLLSHKK